MVPDSIIYLSIVVFGLALCWLWMRHDHASQGPDAEKASGARPGESPTEAPVVSGGTHLRLERAPARDRAFVLSSVDNRPLTEPHRGIVVGSRVGAGAPIIYYRWVDPEYGKKLVGFDWELWYVAPDGEWLIRKEERWR